MNGKILLPMLLALVSMLGPFGMDAFLPAFSTIARQFSVSDAVVQLSLSVYLAGLSVMSLFHGTLSDALGRRPVVLATVFVFMVSSVGAALSQRYSQFLLFRAVEGLSAGAGIVVAQAIVKDLFNGPRARQLLAHITVIFSLAPAVAPVLGGYLHHALGWRAVFWFLAVFSLALYLLCARCLAETLPCDKRARLHVGVLLARYRMAVGDSEFLCCALALAFGFAGFGLYIASAPGFVSRVLHWNDRQFGWLFAAMIGGLMSGSILGARLASRMGSHALIRAGMLTQIAACVGNLALSADGMANPVWLLLPVAGYTLGLGMTLPALNEVALSVLPGAKGMAASLLNFAQMMLFAGCSALLAPRIGTNALALACAASTCCVLMVGFWSVSRWYARHGVAAVRT